ncbi:MAG TPA: FecR family protein, partial [Chthoniobacterales bacterium]
MSRFSFSRFASIWPWLLVAMTVVTMDWAARAAQPKAAQVTAVIKDVKLLPPQAPPHPAVVSETLASGTGLRTGVDSRAELTFPDLTITRLGANTVFSFNEGARELNLDNGAILVQVPKSGSAVKVSTAGFTCGVTGGTALCETNKGAPSKVMILEGSGHFCARGGGCVDIPAGEMVVMMPDGRYTQPLKFNVARVMETSL